MGVARKVCVDGVPIVIIVRGRLQDPEHATCSQKHYSTMCVPFAKSLQFMVRMNGVIVTVIVP